MEELKLEDYFTYWTTAHFTVDYPDCGLTVSDALMDRICKDFNITREELIDGFPANEDDEGYIEKTLTISYMVKEGDFEKYKWDVQLNIAMNPDGDSKSYYLDDESEKLLSSMIDGAERAYVHFMYEIMRERILDKMGFFDCKPATERELEIIDELPNAMKALWK